MRWMGVLSLSACTVALAWLGCGDDESGSSNNGGMGGTTTTTTTMTTTTTTSSTGPCVGGPDGVCNAEMEACDCEDCAPFGLCDPGACDGDPTACDEDLDSCTCPECDLDYICSDPADLNCTDDAMCEPYGEGCACADCLDYESCTDNVMACNGMAQNDVCDVGESCDCVDCLGTVACVPCTNDGECGYTESCLCADCTADPFCTDAQNCSDDTICAPLYEGCICADCAGEALCQGGTGGGGGN